jgi:hypothetical protein
VSTFLSAEMRDELKTHREQADYMEGMKLLAPIHYQTVSLNISQDGRRAEVDLSGRMAEVGPTRPLAVSEKIQLKQNPPQTQGSYLVLKFVRESGQWKMEPPQLLGEGRCDNTQIEQFRIGSMKFG